MKDIQIVSTGGTFNKIYNPLNGKLEIDRNNLALKEIQSKWLCQFNIDAIINKDSLDFTNQDREELTNYIQKSEFNKIIIIHGTDTMDLSAQYLASQNLNLKYTVTGIILAILSWITIMPYIVHKTKHLISDRVGYIFAIISSLIMLFFAISMLLTLNG